MVKKIRNSLILGVIIINFFSCRTLSESSTEPSRKLMSDAPLGTICSPPDVVCGEFETSRICKVDELLSIKAEIESTNKHFTSVKLGKCYFVTESRPKTPIINKINSEGTFIQPTSKKTHQFSYYKVGIQAATIRDEGEK